MDDQEITTLSFVVRIWIEETRVESDQVLWRGHVTHVPSRTRRYVQDLGDITDFVGHYLKQVGVQIETP